MHNDEPTGTQAALNDADLRDSKSEDAVVARAVTIDRRPEELYAYWRDFSNLAVLMENIERIETIDAQRSHWVVKGPAGKAVEWDSLVTEDIPNRRIAWRAAEGADVQNSGWVEFRPAPGERGTEVHALIAYDAPGGSFGRLIAKILQREPNTQMRRELRRFKQLMETGEITSSEGPSGRKPKPEDQ
jgi:uncharacterized membrane protein